MKPASSPSPRPRRGIVRSVPALLSRYKLSIALALGAVVALYVALQPPEIGDLSEEHRHYTGELLQSWQEGRVVALMRHLERCDKYDLPCLTEDPNGLTARSRPVGEALREDFQQLGLEKAIIYNSPLSRTAQTEMLVFGDSGEDRDWLVNCELDFLDQVLSNKPQDRNLILVTHSHCINRVQEVLGYDDEDPHYGAVVFLLPTDLDAPPAAGKRVAGTKPGLRARVLGFLDADDWDATLGF